MRRHRLRARLGTVVVIAERTMDDLDGYTAAELRARLERLRVEHSDLDGAISALETVRPDDQLAIGRLKKRKLRLKDEIAMIEDRLLPDIIA